MIKRADWGDRVAALAVALGLLAVFLPWYSYSAAASRVSVNAFRASLLGDVFFIALAVEGLLLLTRHGLVDDLLGGRIGDRGARYAVALVAGGAVILQLILVAAGGRSIAGGMILAILSVAALAAAAWLLGDDVEQRRTVREMLGSGLPD